VDHGGRVVRESGARRARTIDVAHCDSVSQWLGAHVFGRGARGIFPRQNRDAVSLLRFSSGEAENRGIGRKKMTLGVHSSASAREKR
jgi:hypothetical protein